MKKIALVLMAAAAAALIAQPAPPDAALKETLVALEKQSWEAWKNRDGQYFQGFLSDDHVEIGFGGVTDKATVVAGVGSPACVVKSYFVDHFELKALGPDTALLTYYADQDTTCGGNPVPSPVSGACSSLTERSCALESAGLSAIRAKSSAAASGSTS